MLRLRRLTLTDCWGIGVAYLYLLWAGWRIWVRHEKLDRWLEVAADETLPARWQNQATVTGRARWVNAAARYPLPWARCLQRSLALCILLRRSGFSPVLKIGVRLDGASLSAHAWVEHEGLVINDSPRAVREFAVLKSADLRLAGSGLSKEGRWI